MTQYKEYAEDTAPLDDDFVVGYEAADLTTYKRFKLSVMSLFFSNVGAGTEGEVVDVNAAGDPKRSGILTAAIPTTGAEVKVLYEAEASAFTDAQFTKLAGVEALAEVNPTDSETKTAYETNADTNAYTDSEKTKLGNLTEGFLGYFADESALTTAHPTGSNGQYANLGSTDTMWSWDTDTVAWVDTGSTSTGDMLISTYDPTAKNGDAFSMDNMTETATKKVLTDTERTKLTGIEALAEVNLVTLPQVLTSTAASVDTDLLLSANATHTTSEDFTLENPTEIVAGGTYSWYFTQGATARVISYGTAFNDSPALTATIGANDLLVAYSPDGTNLIVSMSSNV